MSYEDEAFQEIDPLLQKLVLEVGLERMLSYLTFNVMWALVLYGVTNENIDGYLKMFKGDYELLLKQEKLPALKAVRPPTSAVN